MSPSLLVVAGEISGDQHAADVVRRVRATLPDLTVWGIGGDALAAVGVSLRQHTRDMAVMGLIEVLRRIGFFRRVLGDLVQEARRTPPDAALLVDYPGFNLRAAARLKAQGVRVIYYVCPQVWAWRKSRIGRIAEIVDRLLVIFPFEKELFNGTRLRPDFVGHPLVESVQAVRDAPAVDLPWSGSRRIALLPGSRTQEISRILPVLAEAARGVRKKYPDAGFLLASPTEELATEERRMLRSQGIPDGLIPVVTGQTLQILKQARAAWVASGTATIETCLMRCPMVVVYRTSALTNWAARRVLQVPHIGMVNLMAGREICPERIQAEASPEKLIEALLPLIEDTPRRARMLEDLDQTAFRLGEGGAAEHAAAILLEELSRTPFKPPAPLPPA
jgi:lipid-A-disaccharide synthase